MNDKKELRAEIYVKLEDDEVTVRVLGRDIDCCLLLLRTLENLIKDGEAPEAFASFVISRMVTLV